MSIRLMRKSIDFVRKFLDKKKPQDFRPTAIEYLN